MNYPRDPYALLWQELAPLRQLMHQFELLLAMLAAYAVLLFAGIGLLLAVAGLNKLLERIKQHRELSREPVIRRTAPARPHSRKQHWPHVSSIRLARPIPGSMEPRRSVFSPSLHRPR